MPASRKPKSIPSPATTASASTAASSSRPSRARQDSSATMPNNDDPNSAALDPIPSSSSPQWTEPPWMGFLETTEDALLILEAARRRLIPRVTRRLADRERRLIQSGSVFVFEEEESGIKRWTDGFLWSPSRILGNFLLYRETDKRNPDGTPATRPGRSNTTSQIAPAAAAHSLLVTEEPAPPSGSSLSRPKSMSHGGDEGGVGGYSAAGSSGLDRARERILLGSLTNSQKFKEDGMMKKTFSLTLPNTTKTHHLVSYYKVSDVEAGRLRTPSSLPEFAALEISPEFLDKTHFRVQPRVEVGEDGRVRFRGETTDESDESPAAEASQDIPQQQQSQQPVHLQSHSQHQQQHLPQPHHPHHSSHHPSQQPHPYHPRSTYALQQSHPTPAYPTSHSHSRNNSLSSTAEYPSQQQQSQQQQHTPSLALAAAAKAQAEASARMYMNGAATAAAAASSSSASSSSASVSSSSASGFHHSQRSATGQFFQAPVLGGGVGSTASSLGLHYPSALGYGSASSSSGSAGAFTASPTSGAPSYTAMLAGASSSGGSSSGHKSRSGSIYSTTTEFNTTNIASPISYSDNSTGAPPFQAPQLYNSSQPSASANSAFATSSYPASLAPGHRSAAPSSYTASSVRSGMSRASASTGAGLEDGGSMVSGSAGRIGRSGSRASDGSGGSGQGSLSAGSTMASTSEAVTPAPSSRRSSTGAMSHYHGQRTADPLALGKMLAVKAEQQDQQQQQQALDNVNASYDMGDMSGYMASFNGNYLVGSGMFGGVGMDDLNLGVDTMIMSPATDTNDSAPAPTNGTWCGASGNNSDAFAVAATDVYAGGGYADSYGYSIPPPTAKPSAQHYQHHQSQQQHQGYAVYQQHQQSYAEPTNAEYYAGGGGRI